MKRPMNSYFQPDWTRRRRLRRRILAPKNDEDVPPPTKESAAANAARVSWSAGFQAMIVLYQLKGWDSVDGIIDSMAGELYKYIEDKDEMLEWCEKVGMTEDRLARCTHQRRQENIREAREVAEYNH